MNAQNLFEIVAAVAMLAAFAAPRFSPNVRLACFCLCIGGSIIWGFASMAFFVIGIPLMGVFMLAFTGGAGLAARRYARFGLRRVTRSQTEAA